MHFLPGQQNVLANLFSLKPEIVDAESGALKK